MRSPILISVVGTTLAGVTLAIGYRPVQTNRRSQETSSADSGVHMPPDSLIAAIPIAEGSSGHGSHRAHPHPHGDKVCASGCALSRHPTARLSSDRFEQLLSKIIRDPQDQEASDELFYFGPQAAEKLRTAPAKFKADIPDAIYEDLMSELSRDHAFVSLQLVSRDGVLLAELPAQRVPLDLRHEYDLIEQEIPPLLASGTVKRVGRYTLWSRL